MGTKSLTYTLIALLCLSNALAAFGGATSHPSEGPCGGPGQPPCPPPEGCAPNCPTTRCDPATQPCG
ncbi:MAG TPA: hypothetical protein VNZ52_03220, partial [Candidatus Thermoplasmatota archaeon]|nr:hypothetical protein [Candidatus Thermoplasmatota archaeon]